MGVRAMAQDPIETDSRGMKVGISTPRNSLKAPLAGDGASMELQFGPLKYKNEGAYVPKIQTGDASSSREQARCHQASRDVEKGRRDCCSLPSLSFGITANTNGSWNICMHNGRVWEKWPRHRLFGYVGDQFLV